MIELSRFQFSASFNNFHEVFSKCDIYVNLPHFVFVGLGVGGAPSSGISDNEHGVVTIDQLQAHIEEDEKHMKWVVVNERNEEVEFPEKLQGDVLNFICFAHLVICKEKAREGS